MNSHRAPIFLAQRGFPRTLQQTSKSSRALGAVARQLLSGPIIVRSRNILLPRMWLLELVAGAQSSSRSVRRDDRRIDNDWPKPAKRSL